MISDLTPKQKEILENLLDMSFDELRLVDLEIIEIAFHNLQAELRELVKRCREVHQVWGGFLEASLHDSQLARRVDLKKEE